MKQLLGIGIALLLFAACGPNADKSKAEIEGLRQQLATATTFPLDTVTAGQLIEKSRAYADRFPEDTASARLLFQAAEVSKAIAKHPQAIELWRRVADKYPAYAKAPESLFLIAFTYDNDVADKENAVESYQAFIDKYPQHELADDAQQLLGYLKSGKTIEDIMKEFEQAAKDSLQ
ncbi:MAG: tetratricopeptide repeat protein [Saprospiraceae bacterium]|nr:tetratricopeptide repeat protein [Saprospiraceae bacterium]